MSSARINSDRELVNKDVGPELVAVKPRSDIGGSRSKMGGSATEVEYRWEKVQRP